MAATTTTTSSPSSHQILLDPHPVSSAAVSRRVPPPCWSHYEIIALIEAYRDKWYSLRRSNLRAHHWEEVATQVASAFPASPKTSVQCRHKMEKLRKRYRAEKQRALAFRAVRNSRFKSNWAHFKHMDHMERGEAEEDEEEDDDHENQNVPPNFAKPVGQICINNINGSNKSAVNEDPWMINGSNGHRIRVPERSAPVVVPAAKLYGNYDEFGVPIPNMSSNFGGLNKVLRNEHVLRGGMGRKVGLDEVKKACPAEDMVEAIRVLGDGFVRTEKLKMDMARQIEEMRMETEIKKTAMILDSQQQIIDAFANAVFGSVSKKQKKMQEPHFKCS